MARKDKNIANQVPGNYEGVVNLITQEYANLSAGFQQIARFLTQNPNSVALESINTLAAKCGTHPSSLVRFAQHFGFSGFKHLQSVFQTRIATAAPGFQERIRALESELSRYSSAGNLEHFHALVVRDIAALQDLLETVSGENLEQAAKLLAGADTVYIAGQLRSEPIASLLRYLLTMLHRRVVLLDPSGGLATEMAATMTQRDVLVAIAFRHYAKEVVTIAESAAARAVPLVALTDSQLSPLAKDADVLFTIAEDEYTFSRSLAAPMCLIQSIATATAIRLQPNAAQTPRIPTVTEGIMRKKR
ncbi:DNA-binding MurR/RpiR family transcriptional regulator [Pseudochelatococcus lubricantis]|uniref:DNA-binding MurR/RpiR family transcriptional regulator n=1 Tax=Pseudochelatococcus lubricantis TaxID=1538102 RepID=A0ABX0V1N2_9HYPH|nr:MurR/RpiR family transcriptional regulator [Pseudochelatococcus lubricantis]NIJ58029.1 DNA-binding MurR/RpiR family transcriptional regulator [Pseudochelatococcus lubricantis]